MNRVNEEAKMAGRFANDSDFKALLGIADACLRSKPQRIRYCIHCLEAALLLNVPMQYEAHVRVQLGSILLKYTENIDLARKCLERAVAIIQPLGPGFEELLCQAVSGLKEIFKICNEPLSSIQYLQLALKETTQKLNCLHLHFQTLFELSATPSVKFVLQKCITDSAVLKETYVNCNKMHDAIQNLALGEKVAQQYGSEYMRCLFVLSRILYLLVSKDYNQATKLLGSFASHFQTWRGPKLQVEHLRIFYLTLQTWLGITSGQPKTMKPFLRQLQQSIQVVTTLTPIEEARQIPDFEKFQWLPVDHLCIIVYLLTVIHCVQAGHVEKSLKYSEKALGKIASLKENQSTHLLSVFELVLLENVIVTHIIEGQSNTAIKQMASAFRVCSPRLLNSHSTMLRTLLGLYCMSMNQMEFAEFHFRLALKMLFVQVSAFLRRIGDVGDTAKDVETSVNINITKDCTNMNRSTSTYKHACQDSEQYSLIALNLCVVYIRMGKSKKLEELVQNLSNPSKASLRSSNVLASYHYVMGLKSFFETKYTDARRYLRETLKIANAEESYRLAACSLILLGHTFLKGGNIQEALDVVKSGVQMADKMPDAYIQLWGASLLRDLYRHIGDHTKEAESFQIHRSFTVKLLDNHGKAIKSEEHKLIEWHKGAPKVPLQIESLQGPSGLQSVSQQSTTTGMIHHT